MTVVSCGVQAPSLFLDGLLISLGTLFLGDQNPKRVHGSYRNDSGLGYS